MKRIVVELQPFIIKQNLFIISEDGENIESLNIDFSDLNRVIFSLLRKYSINQIDLVGPKSFTKGIQEKLLKDNSEKYGNKPITIKLI